MQTPKKHAGPATATIPLNYDERRQLIIGAIWTRALGLSHGQYDVNGGIPHHEVTPYTTTDVAAVSMLEVLGQIGTIAKRLNTDLDSAIAALKDSLMIDQPHDSDTTLMLHHLADRIRNAANNHQLPDKPHDSISWHPLVNPVGAAVALRMALDDDDPHCRPDPADLNERILHVTGELLDRTVRVMVDAEHDTDDRRRAAATREIMAHFDALDLPANRRPEPPALDD